MRALIFSTHTGGGHDAAAHAVAQALEQRGVTAQVMDCVAFGGARFSRIVSRSYVTLVQRHPESFGKIYHLGAAISSPRFKSPIYWLNTTYAFRMARGIKEFGADMIVCTHMFGGQSVTHLRKHGQYKGFFAMVMTDYTLSPFMEDIHPDMLCVSHPSVMAECRRKGMPDAILVPLGIPVSPQCKPCEDREAAKEKVGIPPQLPHILLVGGSMGAGNLPQMVERLLQGLPEKMRITVVCGTNEVAQKEATEQFRGDDRVRVLGKVSPLYDLIAAADVLLTKSGGLTTTEAMTIGTPMVIAHPIVGCETANAELMERLGLALYARNMDELPEKVMRLLGSKEARASMIAAQHREIDPECSGHLADYLIEKTRLHMENDL